jgi:HSP20 family molecular chaperone IbpA
MDMNTPRTREETETAGLLPPVDIFEDGDGITLKADLPGVAKENLGVRVDGDTLTIEATMNLGESHALQHVYAEVRFAQYRRSFVLSRDPTPRRSTRRSATAC